MGTNITSSGTITTTGGGYSVPMGSPMDTGTPGNVPWEVFSDQLSEMAKKYKLPPLEWEPPQEKERRLERTFVMIKPDAFERGLVGEILDLVTQRGLNLIAFKTVQLTPEDCEQHYSHHVGKDFYPKLVEFMTSGPALAMIFEGDNACHVIRQMIGNSKHPSQVPAGSIRGRYALDFPRNLIHGSDHSDDASRESRIYLGTADIFDKNRLENLRGEFAARKEELQAERRKKVEQGIKLGDEVFCPEVLQEGDWLASIQGMTLIKSVEPVTTEKKKIQNADVINITREDYFSGCWGEQSMTTFPTDEYESSMDFTWTQSSLYLVGRDGEFLDGFSSKPVQKPNGHRYIWKTGRWLPIFRSKSQQKFKKINTKAPFTTHYDAPNGFTIYDIFDPLNEVVLKIATKDDSQPWRFILGGTGQELAKQQDLKTCTTSMAMTRLRIWSKKAPGQMSVLLRHGVPYAASYGDNKQHSLAEKGPVPF